MVSYLQFRYAGIESHFVRSGTLPASQYCINDFLVYQLEMGNVD